MASTEPNLAKPSVRRSLWRDPRVVVAIIGALTAIVVAYLRFAPEHTKKEATLTGAVYGRKDVGLKGATLTLKTPNDYRSLSSLDQGYFTFSHLPGLEGTLTVSADGYQLKTRQITLADADQFVAISLAPIETDPRPDGPASSSDIQRSLRSPVNETNDPPSDRSPVPTPFKARAEANIGWSYEIGEGGAADYASAMKWYRKAVEDGDVIANWNIARLYEHGLGVQKDLSTAQSWYEKAVEKGDTRSAEALKHLGQNALY